MTTPRDCRTAVDTLEDLWRVMKGNASPKLRKQLEDGLGAALWALRQRDVCDALLRQHKADEAYNAEMEAAAAAPSRPTSHATVPTMTTQPTARKTP